jgi:hypothetical protein
MLRGTVTFIAGMAAAFLPFRRWSQLPAVIPVQTAAFASGLATLFAGAAIGIPGFLEHAHATTSLGIDGQLAEAYRNASAGYSQGLSMGFSGLSVFTFLLLTPKGWLTLYLIVSGTLRGMAAWFDDPVGDPILTGLDTMMSKWRATRSDRAADSARAAIEGPEVPDRMVSSQAAGIPGCDLVVVSSRRKAGWERGVAVFTQEACYRLGEPVEQMIAGRRRYLYPLTEHTDFEAIRRSVQYELPTPRQRLT